MNDVCTGGNPRETSVADIEKNLSRSILIKLKIEKELIMFKTNVGYSVAANATDSGRETATKASEGLNPKSWTLFTSCVQNQKMKLLQESKVFVKICRLSDVLQALQS